MDGMSRLPASEAARMAESPVALSPRPKPPSSKAVESSPISKSARVPAPLSGFAEALPPVVGGGHAGMGLEGAVEGAERLKAGIERDGDDRHLGLGRIGERRHRLFEAVAVDEGVEVA